MKDIDEYIQEAYDELVKFSANKENREEYKAREKVLRDNYSFLMDTKRQALIEGRAEGLAEGLEQGIVLAKKIYRLYSEGKSVAEIAMEVNISSDKVREILE